MFTVTKRALNVCKSAKICGPLVRKFKPKVRCPWTGFSTLNAPHAGPNEAPSALEEVTKGDPQLEHKLKVIMLETEVMRQEGKMVPPQACISPEEWRKLVSFQSRSARTKYLGYLFKTAKTKENRQAKKLERRQELEESRAQLGAQKSLSIEEHALRYGLSFNNIFLRFYESSMNHFYNGRLLKAMQFGQKLVIDCGYDRNMSTRENQNAAKQLMFLFSENRIHHDPFDLHLTNMRKESELTRTFRKHVPTMYDRDFPLNVSERSYLELMPKAQLIYLTPHCREEMESFDHDAIYIIGGIVDKLNNEPLSLAKAKREGLQMRKFPLDRYLQWGAGSGKSLTLNHCVSILLDLKATGDWRYALRHVPRRKLADSGANRAKWRGPRAAWTRSLLDE